MSGYQDWKNVGSYIPTSQYRKNNDTGNEKLDVKKYVVTASIKSLFNHLLRNFNFLGRQTEEKVGKIAKWAPDAYRKVVSIREQFTKILEDLTKSNRPRSGLVQLFGCTMRTSNDGSEFWYSHWYHGIHRVDENFLLNNGFVNERGKPSFIKFLGENNLTVDKAQTLPLFDQLCYRFSLLEQWLDQKANSDADIAVNEEIKDLIAAFYKLHEDTLPYLEELHKIQAARRALGRQNKMATTQTKSKPSSDNHFVDWSVLEDSMESEAVESAKTPHAIPISPQMSQPVQKDTTFADKVKNTKSTPEKTNKKTIKELETRSEMIPEPKKTEEPKASLSSPMQRNERKNALLKDMTTEPTSEAAEIGKPSQRKSAILDHLSPEKMVVVSMIDTRSDGTLVEKQVLIARSTWEKIQNSSSQ